MLRRTYRVVACGTVMFTVFDDAGSKEYVAAATSVVKLELSTLPSTESVSVRPPQPDGSLRVTLLMATDEPRSTWIHCGKALLLLSQ